MYMYIHNSQSTNNGNAILRLKNSLLISISLIKGKNRYLDLATTTRLHIFVSTHPMCIATIECFLYMYLIRLEKSILTDIVLYLKG